MNDIKHLFLPLILVTLLPVAVLAQQKNPGSESAARIVLSVGEFNVERDGESLLLGRRDEIYEGDTLFTGIESHAQLRFADGAILLLEADSKLHISSYQYEDQTTDSLHIRLDRGSLRTIVGKISGEAYVLEMPAATVEPEGGDYRVLVVSEESHDFAVFDGAITINSPDGSLRLGAGADYDFAELLTGTPPVGLR